jgi:hypothetical protein
VEEKMAFFEKRISIAIFPISLHSAKRICIVKNFYKPYFTFSNVVDDHIFVIRLLPLLILYLHLIKERKTITEDRKARKV